MVSDWRVGEGNTFLDRDGSLFQALYFSRGCFNEGCTHSSLLHKRSSTLHAFFSLFLHTLLLLVKGSARRFETVLADGTVAHRRRLAGGPPLTLFSLCFLAVISSRILWARHGGRLSSFALFLYYTTCLRINETA
jgi:hypothetical protein